MEKIDLKKLIANDIVNYGMDQTMGFQYVVSLDDFMEDYSDKTKEYIKSNISEIYEDIKNHEAVSNVNFDKTRNEFDLVFYINSLLSPLEKTIYSEIEQNNINESIELEEIREIAYNINNSDEYKNLIKKENF